ncbi:hypothetical protein G9A89_021231 [Geosiphon pyriformis]|nr:hypothetical protein G9A89_021231 [Geosiphon pyriformis]
MLLVLLNCCLVREFVLGPWREAWVSIIPKPYEWESVLMNTCPIALIKTAYKVLSKIFLDRISSACSTFDILCENNFSVLKGTSTQSPIFAIGFNMCKAYDFVGWVHLKESLVRIKMCNRFIRFFGGIHNSHVNRVITDFGLTDGYCVHDGLDQGQCIFYDLLLCEIKRQKCVYGYRLNSHFVSKNGQAESQAELTLFFAAGAFVDDTIWVGSSQTGTQHIFDIAGEFFRFNNISINNDKTVAISINCQVASPHLTISGAPITIAKKNESHHYLGIFLSTEGLSKSSMAKAHLDVRFLVNLVLRKAISNKQSGLSYDFLSNALHHPSLYNLKSFEQIQAKSKSASAVFFANSAGISGEPVYCKYVASFQRYGIVFVEQLCNQNGVVFDWRMFKHWKQLDFCGPVPLWFELLVHFLVGVGSSFVYPPSMDDCFSSDIFQSDEFGIVSNSLLCIDASCLSVYTNGFLSELRTLDMRASAAVFFEDVGLGLGIGVSGLILSTIIELQAIALALECVPLFHHVDLFSDSQAALDACKMESLLNLVVNWVKIKGHSGVSDNKHANKLAKDVVFSDWFLSHLVGECFLKASGTAVSGNSRYFVHNVFRSIGSGSRIVVSSLCADIDWYKSSLVWHSDSHLTADFTSMWTTGFQTYFMKCYPSVVCLFCGDIKVSDHIFSCLFDAAACAWLLDAYVSVWLVHFGLFCSSLHIVQLLATCATDKVAFMEKNNLIPCDGFIPISVTGLSLVFSAGVIRLLEIADALGVGFGFCKFCLFFSGIGNLVSVNIRV